MSRTARRVRKIIKLQKDIRALKRKLCRKNDEDILVASFAVRTASDRVLTACMGHLRSEHGLASDHSHFLLPGYWDFADWLARDQVAAQELLTIFTKPTGSWQERANNLTGLEIVKRTAAQFLELTELSNGCDRAAEFLDEIPGLRAAEPVASAVIDGWFNGGKDYLRQRFPPFGQARFVNEESEEGDEDQENDAQDEIAS